VADIVIRLITEQRKRAVAGILGHAEHSAWWERLSVAEQRALRDKVLADFGVFYDLVRDVVKVGAEDAVINEHTARLIGEIHARVSV
jgi:hypothetical protein